MQPLAAPTATPRPHDAGLSQTQRLMALGVGNGAADFLSLLMQSREATLEAAFEERPPESKERERDPRQRQAEEVDGESPAAVAAPAEVFRTSGPRGEVERARPEPSTLQAVTARPPERPETQQEARPLRAEIKAAVEPVALESRPRASLTAGTSPVALAAQDQAAASAAGEGRGAQPAAAQAEVSAQRPDFAQMARAAAHGRSEPAAEQANTTMAVLDAQARKTAQQQAAGGTGAGGVAASGQTPAPNQTPGHQALAQAAHLPAQAAEQAQGAPRLAQPANAAGKPQSFMQSLATLDSLSGTPGSTQPAAKTETAAAPKPAQASAKTQQPAVDQVAVQIQKAAAAGKDRIQIKLNPAELGRVDVKLEFQSDGGVRALVSVERPETFELLQRDARGLERALADAGFKGAQTSLSFEMQSGGQGQGHGNGGFGSRPSDDAGGRGGAAAETADLASADGTPSPAAASGAAGDGGVDIRI